MEKNKIKEARPLASPPKYGIAMPRNFVKVNVMRKPRNAELARLVFL